MKRYEVNIPLDDQFKNWLKTTPKSASSYVSRLRRLFLNVFDEFFPKKKNKAEIKRFHEIFNILHDNDKGKAAELLKAMRELSFDKRFSKKRTNIPENSYSDCRTALEKYYVFYKSKANNSCSNKAIIDQNAKDAIDDIINAYHKKEFTKEILYNIIRFRRRTEGRYTGVIYYPIEIIDTVFKKHSVESKNWFENWLSLIVDKIKVLIDKNGKSISFDKLRDSDSALKINKRKVYIFRDKGNSWEQVYTHTDVNGEVKPMKVSIFQSIDIDHTVAISNMLNKFDYPAFAKLTELIKDDKDFPKKGKKNQVKFLRGKFYKNNKETLDKMIGCIKNDLEKLRCNVEFEMMDGHYNKKKSNK